jgi:predicted dehydrogenase
MSSRDYTLGVMGCGTIFPAYMKGLARFDHLNVKWAADIVPERAQAAQDSYGIPHIGTPAQLLADDEIDVVVNLTWPKVHHDVSMAALRAGKHVYSEKVIGITLTQARELQAEAASRDLLLGSAPDTFLGGWGATSRGLVDAGALGTIIGGTAFVTHNRVEHGHPDPTFLFERGAGPALDRGPYYVTALVNLLGPVAEVSGMTAWGPRTRIMTNPARRVDVVPVEVPTHWTGQLRFHAGAVVTVVFSSDIWANELPELELYGTKATMSLPNPNFFDGDVRLAGLDRDANFVTVPPAVPLGGLRGQGVADLVAALGGGAPQRASAELATHVLEVLLAIEASSDQHQTITIETPCERPIWPALGDVVLDMTGTPVPLRASPELGQ